MRLVEYTDKDGYKHLSYIKDNQSDSEAKNGLPADPPDIKQLDWEGIKRDIHNSLVDQRLINWQAVQRNQNSISGIVNKIVRKAIIGLYRGGL